MSACRFFLVLAAGLFCSAPPALAILIESKDGKEQVAGFLVSDDKTTMRIKKVTEDSKGEIKEVITPYLHAKYTIKHQLDEKILTSLSKVNPKGYHDYAEELARVEKDPEARETAKRLYLIAAKLEPDKFRSSSLAALEKLAGPSAEKRKYQALAFLCDPKASPESLKTEVPKPASLDENQKLALELFTTALQQYRTGQPKPAKVTAGKQGVDKIFSMAKFDQKTFIRWCDDANCTTCRQGGRVVCPICKGRGYVPNMFGQNEQCTRCNSSPRGVPCPDCDGTLVREPLPDQSVRDVLQYELWALELQNGGEAAGRKEAAGPKGWSSVLQSGRLRPVLRLSLETVTDFNLSETRYRDRMWVEE